MKFKDIIEKVSVPSDKKTKQKDYLADGSIPIIDQGKLLIGGFSNETSKVISCELPVIVFGDHTKVVKYLDFQFSAGADGIKVLKPKSIVMPKYLYYGTQYLTYKIEDKGYARHYQFLEKSDLYTPTLPEQNRIVEKLDELFSELDNGIEILQKTKEQLKVYRQAVLKDIFDSIDNIVSITEAFEITGGLTKNSKRNLLELKMPYLRVGNVYYNHIDLSEIKTIGVTEQEIGRTLLYEGDLLFVEGNGSKEQIGRVAIWDDSVKDCLHQNHIIKGRPNGMVDSKFALYYLMSKNGRLQILKIASSTSGLYTLSINKIKSINIPYCSLVEQQQIVREIESRLSICDQIEKTVDESLEKAESLRQSILKQIFDGRLD